MKAEYTTKNSRTYRTWCGVKQRCDNSDNPDFPRYGGRGISYDPRWEFFEAFLSDMGSRPKNMSLDRIDNNGNYCKDNCRWATKSQQALNTKVYKNNLSGIKGVTRHSNGLWRARGTLNGITYNLYQGPIYFEAVTARKQWESINGIN